MILLVCMPFVSLKRPSLALGLLQATLSKAELASRSLYATLEFARLVGLERYMRVAGHPSVYLLGEWIFAGALFPDFEPDHERFFREQIETSQSGPSDPELRRIATELRDLAPAFLDSLAERIIEEQPSLVGCTSTFQQHCASLALLKRLKAGGLTTMLGGANCEGPMGTATKRLFPFVDEVVSGEADELLVPMVKALLDGKPAPPRDERASVKNVRTLPIPDFDDYFKCLEEVGMEGQILPALPVETSRGCWWGAKHHCTFCGLNGHSMNFRSKDPQSALEELDFLSHRYNVREFFMVDNILDLKYLKTLIPSLADRSEKYEFFYETKANLKREQLALMAQAGITYIQPGIESLSDELLALMDKGTTALQNVQLLKWARELGINVTWLLLFGFPGDRAEWYQDMAEMVPSLTHLQPPNGLIQIGFHRFSPYFERAADYGLDLVPEPGYSYLYPFPESDLGELVYYFVNRTDHDAPRERDRDALDCLGPSLEQWRRQFWRDTPAILSMEDSEEGLHVFDTRPVSSIKHSLYKGTARDLLLACDRKRPEQQVLAELDADGSAILENLVKLKLILRYKDSLLSLPTKGSIPSIRRRLPSGQIKVLSKV
jgi:ribosomal peptide maturation radical SAM protein 1